MIIKIIISNNNKIIKIRCFDYYSVIPHLFDLFLLQTMMQVAAVMPPRMSIMVITLATDTPVINSILSDLLVSTTLLAVEKGYIHDKSNACNFLFLPVLRTQDSMYKQYIYILDYIF